MLDLKQLSDIAARITKGGACMNSDVKMTFAAFFSIASLFTGMNYMVTQEKDSGMLGIAIAFFILAVLFWLWLRQQSAGDDTAESAAQRSIEKAEIQATELRDAVKSQLERPVKRSVPIQTEAPPEPEKSPEPKATTPPIPPAPSVPATPVESEIAPAAEPAPEPAAEASSQPEAVAEDALERIEGIGPKYKEILIAAGIKTFAQIAAMTEEQIVETIRAGGGRKAASMATWTEQAKLAAKGDWDGLAKFQETLTGGRRED